MELEMNNKWNLFNQIVSQHREDKEEKVQKVFEQMFAASELFSYSQLFGEIDSHRVLHIGSTDRVIPDIIIRDASTNKDLFIVELKQLNMKYDKKFEDQLLSYMRLLSLSVGVLICDAIYVCVLDNNKPALSKIDMCSNNANGSAFIEMFSKGSFSVDKVRGFILQSQKFDENVQKIRDEIKEIDVKEVVKSYFLRSFKETEIDAALNDIDFVLRDKSILEPLYEPVTESNDTDGADDSAHAEKIQDWVKRIFRYLLNNKLLTKEEIYRLHDLEYSKRTFGVGHAMLVDYQKDTKISGHDRYWQTTIGGYYICSQWWKTNDREYDSNIRRWLSKVLPDYINKGLGRR